MGGELNRKQLASAYYRFEILCEIQENKLDQPIGKYLLQLYYSIMY